MGIVIKSAQQNIDKRNSSKTWWFRLKNGRNILLP